MSNNLKIRVHETNKPSEALQTPGLSDADRKFLAPHTINKAQLNAFEREFPKLKFTDTFFPNDKTSGDAPDEIPVSAEDAETMLGSRESFLLLCLDALRSASSIEKVQTDGGEDFIRAYSPDSPNYPE